MAGGREDILQGLQRCVVACSAKLLPSACCSRNRREREQAARGTESLRLVCEPECSWQGVTASQPWCLGVDSIGLRAPTLVSSAGSARLVKWERWVLTAAALLRVAGFQGRQVGRVRSHQDLG